VRLHTFSNLSSLANDGTTGRSVRLDKGKKMKSLQKNSNQYQSSLQNYALSLSADEGFMSKIGLSERVLDFVLQLPHGERESEFVKYVLELDHSRNFFKKAA